MRRMQIMTIVSALAVAPVGAQQARNTMTNGDVIDMVRAGLSSAIVIQSIRTTPSALFDVSPRALIDLRAAGVREEVLSEMLARAAAGSGMSAPAGPEARSEAPSAPAIRPPAVEPPPSAASARVNVPDGTAVHLKLVSPLSSATAQPGDRPRFQVLEDVKIAGVTVIAKGAAAEGKVIDVKKAGALGRGGSLHVAIVSVRAVDDSVVPVRLERTQAGQGGTTATVTSVAVDASTSGTRAARSAAGKLLAKGKEAAIPANTEFTAFVDGTRDVAATASTGRRSGGVRR